MNEFLTNLLYARYPRLYRGRFPGVEKSGMAWGFCCGDGWFDLHDRLSADIEAECQALLETGWSERDLPVTVAGKEKCGSLRFRVSLFPPPAAIECLIKQARVDSEPIFEVCGRPLQR